MVRWETGGICVSPSDAVVGLLGQADTSLPISFVKVSRMLSSTALLAKVTVCEFLAKRALRLFLEPSQRACRVLKSINRMIVHLVNDMQFSVNHKYIRSLNEFIHNNTKVMQGFLIELSVSVLSELKGIF